MVCKALVDAMLDADVARVRRYTVRFADVVFPGETLRTQVWRRGDALIFTASTVGPDARVVLADGVMIAAAS
jgi:acyl dehydratase